MYQGASSGAPSDEKLQCGKHKSPTHPVISQSPRQDLNHENKISVITQFFLVR